MPGPKVAVIVLNWNNYADSKRCLMSLRAVNYADFSTIVVDNGSDDGSAARLQEEFPECQFILNDRNEGFARAMNRGFRLAIENGCEFVLSLNNDTVVQPDFLDELIKEAVKERSAGIFSPKLLSLDCPQIIDSTGHVFGLGAIIERGHGRIDRGQYDGKPEVLGACAASALYRVSMLKAIGLFDESYETQYEDAELSWRAHKSGWKARFVPLAIVFHKRGGTKKKDDQLRFQMEVVSTLRNVSKTVKRHGTMRQKFFHLLYLGKKLAASVFPGKERKNFRLYRRALSDFLRSKS